MKKEKDKNNQRLIRRGKMCLYELEKNCIEQYIEGKKIEFRCNLQLPHSENYRCGNYDYLPVPTSKAHAYKLR